MANQPLPRQNIFKPHIQMSSGVLFFSLKYQFSYGRQLIKCNAAKIQWKNDSTKNEFPKCPTVQGMTSSAVEFPLL